MTPKKSPDPGTFAMTVQTAVRRKMAETSVEAFARIYLAKHFSKPPSPMHREVVAVLQEMTESRGARVAIAAPRGHAKSTIVSMAYILWSICHERERFIVIFSDTASQANDLLGHVKDELEKNARLAQDFPGVCEEPESNPGPPRWRQDEIVTRNEVRVVALGAGKKIRGRRYRQHRPSLIILDDVENEEQVSSADRREKLETWFQKAVLKSGDARTNVVVVGTVMHYDSLLCRLLDLKKSPNWEGRKYQAVTSWATRTDLWQKWENIFCRNEEHEEKTGPLAAKTFFEANEAEMLEGSAVLWPELESYDALMVLRLTDGEVSFDSEKMNEPVNPADCYFRPEEMRFWDDEYDTEEALISALGTNGLMFGACDPSLGKAGRNRDYSAIITIIFDRKEGIGYVLDADIARRRPDDLITAVTAFHERRKYRDFAFEDNQFQEFVADELSKRSRQAGSQVPVRKVTSRKDKLLRIQSLQPKVKVGALRFCRKHRLLTEQLRQFPKGAHDDGPDALEMAFTLATERSRIPEIDLEAYSRLNRKLAQMFPRITPYVGPIFGGPPYRHRSLGW